MLTSKQICELIARGETFRLECKKAMGGLPSSLWPSYCAFANSDGGVILLGVEEGFAGLEIVGVEDSARLIRDFWNSVNNPRYFLDYRERTHGEERWSDRVCAQDSTWSGNIYDFFFKVQDRITADVKVPFTLTTRAVEKAVGKLKADGKVKRIGPKKGGHWVVSSSGVKAFPSPIRREGKPLTEEEIDVAKKLGRR